MKRTRLSTRKIKEEIPFRTRLNNAEDSRLKIDFPLEHAQRYLPRWPLSWSLDLNQLISCAIDHFLLLDWRFPWWSHPIHSENENVSIVFFFSFVLTWSFFRSNATHCLTINSMFLLVAVIDLKWSEDPIKHRQINVHSEKFSNKFSIRFDWRTRFSENRRIWKNDEKFFESKNWSIDLLRRLIDDGDDFTQQSFFARSTSTVDVHVLRF